MPYNYGELYPSSSLPRELVDVPSGEVRYYEGTPYRVLNESGGRRLERPSFSETGVSSADRLQSPEGQLELAQKIQQQQLETRKLANEPIAKSYEAGKPTLQARYRQILDDLSFREQEETAKITQRQSSEFGKRGIPLSSTYFTDATQEALQPTRRFYSGERSNVGITEQEKLDQINQAVALLRAGNPAESLPMGLNLFGNISSSLEASKQREQQQSQFETQLQQAMKIAEMQNRPQQTQSKLDFANVLGGGYIYNPMTGEVVNTLKDLRGLAGGSNNGGQRPPLSSFLK